MTINRRFLLKAGTAQILALSTGMAWAQSPSKTKKTRKKAARTSGSPVEGDERINRMLAAIRDEHHLPGLIGAIQVGSRLAAIGAVGVRKIGSPQPIRVTDTVHLGSCTKPMTATMIATLVEQRKLSWGSTLRDVFPEAASEIHPQYQGVTLSHLLTHRASLPHDWPWWQPGGTTPTEKRWKLMTTMLVNKPASRPGSSYDYSNVGYVLAGLMAEHVTGEPWELLMQERLFGPLDMETAGFGSPARAGSVDQPWGHRRSGSQITPTLEDNGPAMGPAGTVHCSVPDWAKFAALHLRGEHGSSQLLKPATLRTLHTPPPGREYAGGWTVVERSWAGGLALNHNGSNTNWYSTIWIAPVLNFAVLIATNRGDHEAATACDAAASELIKSVPFLTQHG